MERYQKLHGGIKGGNYQTISAVPRANSEKGHMRLEGENIMLELTVTAGMELQIGDDVKIVFRDGNAPGRMKIGVDASKDKRIERIKVKRSAKESA